MNPQVKEKWVEALRSGKYVQGVGVLRKQDTYCCLGVLCDLYLKEHPEPWNEWHKDYFMEDGRFKFMGRTFALPESVRLWAELDYDDPVVRVPGTTNRDNLSNINDRGTNFHAIAGMIEEQL